MPALSRAYFERAVRSWRFVLCTRFQSRPGGPTG
jgi:hypothetical protein